MQTLINWAIPLSVAYSIFMLFVFSTFFGTQADIEFSIYLSCLGLLLTVSISYFSTWNKLSNYYQTEAKKYVNILLFKSGSIGSTDYRNCLKVGVINDGIYLYNLSNILALFNKPLLIPWNAISEVLIDRDNFHSDKAKTYTIKIKTPDFTTKLILPIETLKDAEEILEAKMK